MDEPSKPGTLKVAGFPNNGFTASDIRYPRGTYEQSTSVQVGSLPSGKPISALVDLQTIWPQGSQGLYYN